MNAKQALAKLKKGNERFSDAAAKSGSLTRTIVRDDMHGEQKPFAVILGCSDSRVPVELIFDQSIGDLFVVRVAGNIAASSQIASVEFACQKFGTGLVIVLGHTQCGAITATLSSLNDGFDGLSPNLEAIVKHIQVAIEPMLKTRPCDDNELIESARRKNIEQSVSDLHENSLVIRGLVASGQVTIVGAEYELESGKVHFFE